MKFCYVDESGYGDEPILVMAGIVVDASRMGVTKQGWNELLMSLANRLERPVDEFKMRRFYRGHGLWHDLNGKERTEFINTVIEWLQQRKHDIVFAAVEKEKLSHIQWHSHPDICCNDIDTAWRTCALHLMLSVQKGYQGINKRKGQTVFIFDREVKEEEALIELAINPPRWTDTFYKKTRNQERLDMVVDVPYFADSKKVGLLQLADMFAYLLRHYAELKQGLTAEKYAGELVKVTEWVNSFAGITLEDKLRWPSRGVCSCGSFYNEIAPDSLKAFKKEALTEG